MRSIPSAIPPCGGAPYSRRDEEPEAVLDLLGAQAEHLEDLALLLGIVDTDRAGAELVAVEHHIVVLRAHLHADRESISSHWPGAGAVNGWWAGIGCPVSASISKTETRAPSRTRTAPDRAARSVRRLRCASCRRRRTRARARRRRAGSHRRSARPSRRADAAIVASLKNLRGRRFDAVGARARSTPCPSRRTVWPSR